MFKKKQKKIIPIICNYRNDDTLHNLLSIELDEEMKDIYREHAMYKAVDKCCGAIGECNFFTIVRCVLEDRILKRDILIH